MAGQAFEIVATRDATGWSVTVPELGAVTHRSDRAEAEMAARELISRHTGIPTPSSPSGRATDSLWLKAGQRRGTATDPTVGA